MKLLYSILYVFNPSFLFEYKNHRRYCKKCNQQQDLFGRPWTEKYNWWEDMGQIKNEDCICHKFQSYRRY